MPNDLPDWTAQAKVNLVGGLSGANLGDVAAPALQPDLATEAASGTSTPSGGGALASFKPAAGATIARVGVIAAFTQGTNTAVTPAFGQNTSSGNLLTAWVTADLNASEPTTGAAGWVKAVSFNGLNGWVQIWVKPNSGASEAAPQFTSAGGTKFMMAGLAEFSGAAIASPTDQTSSAASVGYSLSVQNSAADVGPGDLVLFCSRWAVENGTVGSETLNNGATPVIAGTASQVGPFGLSHVMIGAYGIVPPATIAQPLGVADWAYDSKGNSAPAAGSQASVVLAATPGKTYTCGLLDASIVQVSGALTSGAAQLLDGATLIYIRSLIVSATPGARDGPSLSGLGLSGTKGNSMTLNINAGVAGALESVTIGAYLR